MLLVLDHMATIAVEFDEQLWRDGSQLWDDAEKLSRYEKQQKAKRRGNRHP